MTRALLPGRWSLDRSRVIPPDACTGNCNQGRACTCETELSNACAPRLELVRSRPTAPARVPVTLTGGRIPRARRMRRTLKALWRFLTASRFEA